MTQAECEQKILQKAREIAEILKEYNLDSDYFDLCLLLKKNFCSFNNINWEDDKKYPIDFNTHNLL